MSLHKSAEQADPEKASGGVWVSPPAKPGRLLKRLKKEGDKAVIHALRVAPSEGKRYWSLDIGARRTLKKMRRPPRLIPEQAQLARRSRRLSFKPLMVELLPEGCRGDSDPFVGERTGVEGQRTAQHLLGEDAFLFWRQMVEGLEQGPGARGSLLCVR